MSVALRLFVAGLFHEASVFSPVATPLSAFQARGDGWQAPLPEATAAAHSFGYGDLIQAAAAAGHQVVQGACFIADPSAPASRKTFDTLAGRIVDSLQQALALGPVHGVLLFMHGAMVADGVDDCEACLLQLLRQAQGSHPLPTGVLLDLHGNATTAMCQQADVLLACREYPHTDFGERAHELVRLVALQAQVALRPAMRLVRLPVAALLPTHTAEARSLLDAMAQVERLPGLLSVSVFHGFAWSDHADVGASVLLVGDGPHSVHGTQAETAIASLCRLFVAACQDFLQNHPLRDADAALDHAQRHGSGTVVLADRSDNPGAGGAGDTTWLLHALRARGVRKAALGMLHDPEAVDRAHRAGAGAALLLDLGGRHPGSGLPFAARVRVLALRTDARQLAFGVGPWLLLGRSAALQVVDEDAAEGGIVIVVNTLRTQTFSRHVFTEHGLDPKAFSLLVVKSTSHFLTDFAPLAAEVVFCDPPGPTSEDLRSFAFKRLPRPLWPLDDLPADAQAQWREG
jgi:microcystin degradation protein MlrC